MHKPNPGRDIVIAYFPAQDPVDHHVGLVGLPEAKVREKVAAGRCFFWHPDGRLSTEGIIPVYGGDDLGPERSEEELAAIAKAYGIAVETPLEEMNDSDLAAHLLSLKITPTVHRGNGKPPRPMTRAEMLAAAPTQPASDERRERLVVAILTERRRREGAAWERSLQRREEHAAAVVHDMVNPPLPPAANLPPLDWKDQPAGGA